MLCYTTYPSPVGTLTLAADETGQALAGLWLEGQKYFPACLERQAVCGGVPILDRAKKWLDRYFAGERPESGELPLVFRGSEFQQAVWEELRRIPYGETVLRPGGGRRGGAQPNLHHRPLPPGGGRRRPTDRLRRRPGAQDLAPAPRGRLIR